MKAVILEKTNKEAVLLCDDGTFQTKVVEGEVGDRIEIDEKKGRVISFSKRMRYVAALLAIVLVLGISSLYYTTSYAASYVSLDVNPSLEYTLNRRNQVLSVEGRNEEGEEISEEISDEIHRMPIAEAIDYTIDVLYEKGYLTDDEETSAVVSVSSDDDETLATVSEEIQTVVENRKEVTLEKDVYRTTIEERTEASENGMTAGRYEQFKERVSADPGDLPSDVGPEDGSDKNSDGTENKAPSDGSDVPDAPPSDFSGGDGQEQVPPQDGEAPADLSETPPDKPAEEAE